MIPATRFERTYGSPPMFASPLDALLASHARREASASRSRTFARIAHEALGDAGLMLDLDAAMQTFEPMPATTQED